MINKLREVIKKLRIEEDYRCMDGDPTLEVLERIEECLEIEWTRDEVPKTGTYLERDVSLIGPIQVVHMAGPGLVRFESTSYERSVLTVQEMLGIDSD